MREKIKIGSWILGGAALLMALAATSRFLMAPVIDLTIDDWYLVSATSDMSLGEIISTGSREIFRPVITLYYFTLAKLGGENPLGYTAFKYILAFCLSVAVFALGYAYTRSLSKSLFSAALFSVLPTIHEPFG